MLTEERNRTDTKHSRRLRLCKENVTQCQLMRLFAVKLVLSYEQKCKVRSKFLKILSMIKNKL